MTTRARAAALACAALLLQAAAGAAQVGHPAPPEPRPRPLHVRLDASDALALGTIAAVELGRIQVGDVAALRGPLPAQLELKRAPSAPPPLAPRERVLLLLRGARSPYLLVDSADELLKLADASQEAGLAAAVRALDAARSQPEAVAVRYADWLAADDALLARAAAQGFEGDEALLASAPPGTGERLAALALGSPDAELRHAAVQAALRQDAALQDLLAALPGAAGDPEVVVRALSAGLLRQREATREAALRSLGAASPQVRGAVLRLGSLLVTDPALRESIARLASDDPDEQVRLAARRALVR